MGLKRYVTLSEPLTLDTPVHPYQPGDHVYIKTWNSEPLKEKWKGPFQILLTTYTAIKIEGIEPWIHYTRVKKAPPDQWQINVTEPSVTRSPSLNPPKITRPVPTGPSGLTPLTFSIGPYVIKNVGQQQILLNPFYSLKRVELSIQINIAELKPSCSPFLNTAHTGWLAWVHGRTPTSRRTQRDLTGTLGTGMGILNSIDAEILANKLAAATKDVQGLQHPLRSSLSALGANQWLLSDILPQWKQINENDHEIILETLGTAQGNISLALSCIQAQLWVQSVASAIIREGEEGVLPSEVRKVIWDNANEFEKEFQFWWQLVNFTYNPTNHSATAFVLTIRNASVHTIYPVIALGLNKNGTILYPIEHKVWAQKKGDTWQTVDVDACTVHEQQGFICESNIVQAQDICLDTEQNICHFEIRPNEILQTLVVYIGTGCVCIRTMCDVIFADNMTIEVSNQSNICVCNFTNIQGCDFNYSAPVTTHQVLQSHYTLFQEITHTPIGMNLTLVRELLHHQDLQEILQKARENGQKTLITIHHDIEKIHQVLERVKEDGEHKWWDTLFGWSPNATGLLNKMLHPVIILLLLVLLGFVLTTALYIKLWIMMKHMIQLTTFARSTANISTDLYMALIEKGEGETFKNLKGSEKFQKGGIVAKKIGL
ncbi:LOW QUALITY PROTEIN: uncharacterized protein LOC142604244 [Balearica regulorum gibbericeps]|uniref:LOW QUALITY PROTEIN: uncharacterized protein LOC142604244 n=1 Tax=Balearica regulorum gibbericeps TaxID=100784 RepID=UPI003F648146